MKTVIRLLALLIIAAIPIGGWAAGIGDIGYTCVDISVTSGTSPTTIATPGRITTWIAHAEASPAADPIRIFFFKGPTAPTAVPSPAAYYEVDSGGQIYDSVTCDQPTCNDGIGQGVAAYLKSGSTANVIDFCTR